MYMHVRQTVHFGDGREEQRESNAELDGTPPPGQTWQQFPLTIFLIRDLLSEIAPLHCWQVTDETGDPFQGVTAIFTHPGTCQHPTTCASRIEVFAWIDEHAEQSALAPAKEEYWRRELDFLNGTTGL